MAFYNNFLIRSSDRLQFSEKSCTRYALPIDFYLSSDCSRSIGYIGISEILIKKTRLLDILIVLNNSLKFSKNIAVYHPLDESCIHYTPHNYIKFQRCFFQEVIEKGDFTYKLTDTRMKN